ncbi:MAG TPA: thioredoxin-like domain-containing protein [Gemmataceae bacterium]|jgi:DNA-binding beta-propeller fold protein YncE|nr:thioredoxin-like domain-containing protein [Gemmataceae bacterium]
MPAPLRRPNLGLLLLAIGVVATVGISTYLANRPLVTPMAIAAGQDKDQPRDERQKAPELDGGVAWLNTAGPIKLSDLKGKIVVLDFWTFCCINCIHTLPDLAKLEQKYEKELVVIGVHSAKFANEKITENIRKAILRYQIQHPVVNDAEMKIWDRYRVSSWPTLAVIDPEGYYLGAASGEGNVDILDQVIQKLIKKHTDNKTLDVTPRRFDTAKFRDKVDSPLFFPGKILADAASNRLFISDSTNHRVVITDLNGKKIAVAGTGVPGKTDGSFVQAQFDDPQGLALDGETLYVADRKNHLIRALDLKGGTVRTAAGVGKQDRENRHGGGAALTTGLNSPWDLLRIGRKLYIAMAGHHQIWTLDLDKQEIQPYAGNGRENIRNGDLEHAEFAQPSGLTTDGKRLYVADSEVSAIRSVSLDKTGDVDTLVGKGLFVFGDTDGEGDAVRLQHALGVVYHQGKLYVADTYNSKLKVLDPATKKCTTFLGGGSGADRLFNEPAGLSLANGKLYVADTNAHRIRVVDLATKQVSTLALQGVDPVAKY